MAAFVPPTPTDGLRRVSTPAGLLPSRNMGLRFGCADGRTPAVVIDVYVDLICPFCKRLWAAFTKDGGIRDAFAALPVQFAFHQHPQPWHFQSSVLHEAWAALKYMGVTPEVESNCISALFAVYDNWVDVNVRDLTKAQLTDKVAQVLYAVDGVDATKLAATLAPDLSDGH